MKHVGPRTVIPIAAALIACAAEPGLPALDAAPGIDVGFSYEDAQLRLDSGLAADAAWFSDAAPSPDGAAPDGAGGLDARAPYDGGPRADAGTRADGGAPAVNPTCTSNGCIRAATLIGEYERAVVQTYLQPGLTIDNGYAAYGIRFYTDGAESTATVTLPFGVGATPPSGGWHIVGNNHATVGVADGCALTGTAAGIGLAGLFGARGMIGVAVDYPGLGTAGDHPYLVSRSQASSALDGLRAATQLAQIGALPVSGRYALVGVSQGGHATLGAASIHGSYAPELDLRAFGATAPATLWQSHLRRSIAVAGAHHVFYTMMLYAWSRHYSWGGPQLWTASFGSSVDAVMNGACLFAAPGTPTLFDQIPVSPGLIYHPDLLSEFAAGAWQQYSHVSQALDLNSVRPFPQTAPLRIYQGSADTTVLEADTREVVDALRGGGVVVDYVVVPGGSHLNVAFGYLAYQELRTTESIAWLRALLDAP